MTHQPVCTIGDNTIDQYSGAVSGRFVGGNAVNVAVHVAQLGHPTRYLGAVGDDSDGRRILGALNEQGVDTSDAVIAEGTTSVSCIAVSEAGERTFLYEDFGTSANYRPGRRELEALAEHAAIHIGMVSDAEYIKRHLAGSRAILSQDCAVTRGYDDLDVAFCSAGADLSAAESLSREAVVSGARLAVCTCGALGSIAFDGTTWWRVQAMSTSVIDTTGAGDSYIAGFLSARVHGADVERAMHAGAVRAALTCGHVGAWPQSPADSEDP